LLNWLFAKLSIGYDLQNPLLFNHLMAAIAHQRLVSVIFEHMNILNIIISYWIFLSTPITYHEDT